MFLCACKTLVPDTENYLGETNYAQTKIKSSFIHARFPCRDLNSGSRGACPSGGSGRRARGAEEGHHPMNEVYHQ